MIRARRVEHLKDRKSTRLNSSHMSISYAVFCVKKKRSENCPRGHRSDSETAGQHRQVLLPPASFCLRQLSFFLLLPRPPRPTLFPYTTLFRSPPVRRWPAAVHGTVPRRRRARLRRLRAELSDDPRAARRAPERSEEHTSELQSHVNLVCRLLREKKKKRKLPSRAPLGLRDRRPAPPGPSPPRLLLPPSALLFLAATPPPETYTLSLHDALPISSRTSVACRSTWNGATTSPRTATTASC